MKALHLKYTAQVSGCFEIRDSQRLHFSVTTATTLHFKEAPLLRGNDSSRGKIKNFCFSGFKIERNGNMSVKKAFFESGFRALQTLHLYFKFNKNQYGKGFKVVTLLLKGIDFVTKRNGICNMALQVCYKPLVTRLVKVFGKM